MNTIKFGDKMRRARKYRDIKSLTLALAIGLNQGETVNRYERAERVPTLETFVDICNALQVSPTFLLADSLTVFDTIPDSMHICEKINLLDEKDIQRLGALVDEMLLLHRESLLHIEAIDQITKK